MENTYEAKLYSVESAESGDVLEDGLTYEEALALIKEYEAEDISDGNYTEGFYAIRNSETEECETITNEHDEIKYSSREEYIARLGNYIELVKEPEETRTEEEWREWIEDDFKRDVVLKYSTEKQIGWIIDELRKEGWVKEA